MSKTKSIVTDYAGICFFCGKPAECEWNQEEIDELATETCECVNARIYTQEKPKRKSA